MTDSNEVSESVQITEQTENESSEVCSSENKPPEESLVDVPTEVVENSEVVDNTISEPSNECFEETSTINESVSDVVKNVCPPEDPPPKNSPEVCEKVINDNQSVEVEGETFSNGIKQSNSSNESVKAENVVVSDVKETSSNNSIIKNVVQAPETFTDSSQSLSYEIKPAVPPVEPSKAPEKKYKLVRTNFQNIIEPPVCPVADPVIEKKEELPTDNAAPIEQLDKPPDVPIIKVEDSSELPAPPDVADNVEIPSFLGAGFPDASTTVQDQTSTNESECEIKVEPQPPPEPEPAPIIPPAPRKRGRPRKQVLPNPSPVVETWPNAQDIATPEVKQEEKRLSRSERRLTKRRKLEEEEEKDKANGSAETPKRRYSTKTPVKKPKKRTTYTPKKKLPPPKKRRSEMENIQNFEEETRMSASEGGTGFSARSGIGDESQSSSITTEGHTKSNINKKGRMEVVTDGCKPVTVQQIVEYFWPPPSSLPHGEKPEGLMIQEQITEYLGVKSFKRKYPSIKRRPVDMEERNYLQENGFVSENMCDMGLTAVFSADILEIMYNDFPQKFDEYRKYTREKKAREQRALREKQAAERADMDPQKEAVESAFSWNNEFNKTRRLTVLHPRHDLRFSTESTPCPPFERVVINHAPNNTALCAENEYWKMSLFSYECEISPHTQMNMKKEYSNQNLWMLVVGSGS